MPFYDYKCLVCNSVTEVMHSISATPELECWYCGSPKMKKMISACSIISHSTTEKRQKQDVDSRHTDIKSELAEDHGVHGVVPIAAKGLDEVYSEIKRTGSLAKDKMQMQTETNRNATEKKQKEWVKDAQKRVAKKNPEIKER